LAPRSLKLQQEGFAAQKDYERLRAEVICLARRQNDMTQPCRLPPELLSEIFIHMSPFNLSAYQRTPEILNASHVCHYWREVALHSPLLWYRIELHRKPEYAKMVIERSKDCSLYVSGVVSTRGAEDMAAILNEAHRICYMSITGALTPAVMSSIRARYPKKIAAPRLYTYVEASPTDSFLMSPYRSDRDQHSFLSLFDAPNLRIAQFTPFLDVWPSFRFQVGLRDLTIVTSRYIEAAIPELLETLRRMPLLESVRLHGLGDGTMTIRQINQNCQAQIDLPKLMRFELAGQLTACATVLANVASPIMCRIHVDASTHDDTSSPLLLCDAFRDVVARIAEGNETHPRTLYGLDILDDDPCELNGWTSSLPFVRECSRVHSADRHGFHISISEDNRVSALLESLSQLPAICAVRYLGIHANRERRKYFNSLDRRVLFDKVETLLYHGSGQKLITDVLEGAEDTLLFPKVQELLLPMAWFYGDHGWSHWDRLAITTCPVCQEQLESLFSLLQRRKCLGLPLQHLVLTPTLQSHILMPAAEAQLLSVVSRVTQPSRSK
jgi:hypothetical protein